MLGKDLGKGTPRIVSRTPLSKLFSRTNSAWEYSFVINIALNPAHQMLNVRRCGHFGRSLVVFRILPEILESKGDVKSYFCARRRSCILIRSLHLRTRLWRAEFGDRSVEEVDMVVEIHHCTSVSMCFPFY